MAAPTHHPAMADPAEVVTGVAAEMTCGILAVPPGRVVIAVWSPGLGRQGQALLATEALTILAKAMGWSGFSPKG
jgi:glutaminase